MSTKRFNEQVKPNRECFPSHFMFLLTAEEKAEVVANCDHLAKLKFSPVLPASSPEPPPKRIGFHVKEGRAKYAALGKR